MNEEKPLETIVTQDEIVVEQVPTNDVDENGENVKPVEEAIDSVNDQVDQAPPPPPSSLPLPAATTSGQNLTHITHQIHSPQSPQSWNFFSGEDIKPLVVDDFTAFQDLGGKSVGRPAETPLSPTKGDEQTTSPGPSTTDPDQLFNRLFGQIPYPYHRSRDVRQDSIGKFNEKTTYERPPTTTTAEERAIPSVAEAVDLREALLDRREREFDRREREFDRRERDLERRERELERRQREFDFDRGRIQTESRSQSIIPQQPLQEVIEVFKNQIQVELSAERKKIAEREALFEEKVMKKVNELLEIERQLYGVMKMSDNEVNEMMERSVGYLLQNDEDIADRVRFQSLVYLAQETLASEAGLQPPQGTDSFSLSWRLALGPSTITEERYNKALELLKDKDLQEATKKVLECKRAMEYAVEYTSHLRKEGTEMSDQSFSLGRIPRKDYMESVERNSKENATEYEALKILVDFICPEL